MENGQYVNFMFHGWIYYKKTKCFYRTNNVTGKTEKITENNFLWNYSEMMKIYNKYVCIG